MNLITITKPNLKEQKIYIKEDRINQTHKRSEPKKKKKRRENISEIISM